MIEKFKYSNKDFNFTGTKQKDQKLVINTTYVLSKEVKKSDDKLVCKLLDK